MDECKCEQHGNRIKYLWLITIVLFMDSCIGCFPSTMHRNNDIADTKSDIKYLTQQVQHAREQDKAEYDMQLHNLRGRIYYLENHKEYK